MTGALLLRPLPEVLMERVWPWFGLLLLVFGIRAAAVGYLQGVDGTVLLSGVSGDAFAPLTGMVTAGALCMAIWGNLQQEASRAKMQESE